MSPIRPKSEPEGSIRQILARWPDLSTVVLPMLVQRILESTEEQMEDQMMVIAGIPREEIRHTRTVQDWLAEGREEGRQQEAASVTLRQLTLHYGDLTDSTNLIRFLQNVQAGCD